MQGAAKSTEKHPAATAEKQADSAVETRLGALRLDEDSKPLYPDSQGIHDAEYLDSRWFLPEDVIRAYAPKPYESMPGATVDCFAFHGGAEARCTTFETSCTLDLRAAGGGAESTFLLSALPVCLWDTAGARRVRVPPMEETMGFRAGEVHHFYVVCTLRRFELRTADGADALVRAISWPAPRICFG